MRLLDLFCGAGGAAVGYHRAGFDDIVGVDIKPQPRYPFHFVQADALDFCASFGSGFDAIHASPPCQAYSQVTRTSPVQAVHVDLIPATRRALSCSGRPFVIENVSGSPLNSAIQLCGSSFGLDLRRHRRFESSECLFAIECAHGWQTPRFPPNRSDRRRRADSQASVIVVAGHDTRGDIGVQEWRRAMGIDWMTRDELAQAIPPAYTEFIGKQLLAAL